jgi:hypothetical protein
VRYRLSDVRLLPLAQPLADRGVGVTLAAQADRNQPEIVARLRAAGCSVWHLHAVGRGGPDLAVGRAGRTYLLEVKRPGGKLSAREETWHANWCGHVAIVTTPEEALRAVGAAP